jgi:Atg29 N-terminal domain
MAEVENHFTVFIRLPFRRGEFVDPPPVSWSAAKERALWEVISRQGQSKGNEIDWNALAAQFQVTQPFILQQAAWLYERQLSQVRAQLRKVGNRSSATPSPAPGSVSSSVVGSLPMKRAGSGGSRAPSRLSTHHVGSPSIGAEGSAPGTPVKSRTSLPLRAPSTGTGPIQPRPSLSSSRPVSQLPSKEADPVAQTHSRRGSTQQYLSRSPGQAKPQPQDLDSDEDDLVQCKFSGRKVNPSATQRRTPSLRKDLPTQPPKAPNEEEDDDSPNFLPFAADMTAPATFRNTPTSPQDPSATLRGVLPDPRRPSNHRRSTSERITSPTKPSNTTAPATITSPNPPQNVSSSGSSLSNSQTVISNTIGTRAPRPTSGRAAYKPSSTAAATLSPRQQAALRHKRHGSESSPSMGSSFSDLDDASVTQSALEEALMSNMGNTTNTVASRVSGIGQALRSRYFDARQAQGYGAGNGHSNGNGDATEPDQGQGRGQGQVRGANQ